MRLLCIKQIRFLKTSSSWLNLTVISSTFAMGFKGWELLTFFTLNFDPVAFPFSSSFGLLFFCFLLRHLLENFSLSQRYKKFRNFCFFSKAFLKVFPSLDQIRTKPSFSFLSPVTEIIAPFFILIIEFVTKNEHSEC